MNDRIWRHYGVPRRALDRPGRTGYCKTSRGDSGENNMLDLYAVEGDLPMTPIENITMVQQRDAVEAARRWGFVCAMARTWNTAEDKGGELWHVYR